MTSHTRSHVWPLLALAAGLSLSTAQAQAPAAADPTRPPDAWLALQPPAPDSGVPQNPDSGARVTVTGAKNHRYAVVDGQVVKPGDEVNGAKVVGIKANAVTLKQNDSRQVLSLTPGVQKIVKKSARRPAHQAPTQ